jgi:hypothetical protein
MFFVTIILVVLAIVMYTWGVRAHSQDQKNVALCLILAAMGTGVIEYLASGLLY